MQPNSSISDVPTDCPTPALPAIPHVQADSCIPPIPVEHSRTPKKSKLTIFIIILLFIGLGCIEYSQPEIKLNLLGIRPSEYDSYIFYAISKENTEELRLLLDAGVDVNKANGQLGTPFDMAISIGNTECIRLLLTAPGIDVNKVKEQGSPLLCTAVLSGNIEFVRLLLATPGIDVNKADAQGDTPLNIAALKGNTECVRLLLATPGIDVNKANGKEITPLRRAEYCYNFECARIIREAGGRSY